MFSTPANENEVTWSVVGLIRMCYMPPRSDYRLAFIVTSRARH